MIWFLCTCELKSAARVWIVPDTCEPTCTVVTALIVPVAWTTFCMSPFCTFSAKYCGVFLLSYLKAVNSPMAARSTPMIVHLFFKNFILHPQAAKPRFRPLYVQTRNEDPSG